MTCPGGADPYAVLGLLIEGTVRTLVEHIPKERQAEIAETLKQLLDERMKACGTLIVTGPAYFGTILRPNFSAGSPDDCGRYTYDAGTQ